MYMMVKVCILVALSSPLYAGPQSMLFFPRADVDTGASPHRMCLGDFDNDGVLDVLSTSDRNSHLTVSLGHPDGTFREAVWSYTHYDVEDCVVADFNQDGFLDAAAALRASPNIAVSFGLGDGRFASDITYAIDGYASNILTADMNADGHPDLVCTYSNEDKVSVFFGSVNGEFTSAIDTNATETGQQAAIIDANDDDIPDLLISLVNPEQQILVYNGSQDGTFEHASTINLDSYATDIVVSDFNGDGLQDFAASTWSDGLITFFTGNGDGTFAPHDPLQASDRVSCIDAGDINGDGQTDIVVASDFGVEVFLFAGSNAFSSPLQYPLPSGGFSDIAIADLNADGHSDVAVSNYYSNSGSVLHGRGDGTLVSTTQFSTEGDPKAIVSADFNGDSFPDLAYINSSWSSLSVALGTSSGVFSPPHTITVWSSPYDMTLGDFNGDGLADLAISHDRANNSKVTVYLGASDGTFALWTEFATGGYLTECVATDLNADGLADLAVVSRGNQSIQLFSNAGDGSFTLVQELVSASPTSLAAGDLDGDDRPEIIVGSRFNTNLLVYVADPEGVYTQAELFDAGGRIDVLTVQPLGEEQFNAILAGRSSAVVLIQRESDGSYTERSVTTPSGVHDIGVADIDQDGNADLVVLSETTYFSVHRGQADGTYADPQRYAFASSTYSMVVADLNGDNAVDVAAPAQSDDQVVISTGLHISTHCLADLNADGELNFFDVSAFLAAYIDSDPIADFNGDGQFNFFDVSTFLVAYQGGCP